MQRATSYYFNKRRNNNSRTRSCSAAKRKGKKKKNMTTIATFNLLLTLTWAALLHVVARDINKRANGNK